MPTVASHDAPAPAPVTAAPPPSQRRSRGRRLARALVGLLVLGVVTLGASALVLQHRLASHLGRIDGAFAGLTERPSRPAGRAGDAVNVLVVTTDSGPRALAGDGVDAPGWLPRGEHVDSVLLLHLAADRRTAGVVTVPISSLGGSVGDGSPSRLVGAVERLTNVRVDHLATFTWEGFAALADLAGGVEIDVAAAVRDPASGTRWPAGRSSVDGTGLLRYVGQRDGLPPGAQALRMQAALERLMFGTLHTAMRRNPLLLYRTLDTVSRHLSVESGWSSNELRNLGISLRNLRSAQIGYVVTGSQAVWPAVRSDSLTSWLAHHPGAQVPDVVR